MHAQHRFSIRLGLLLSTLVFVWPAGAADGNFPPVSECPQPRFTMKAPADIYGLSNPVKISTETLAAGESLYRGKTGSTSCTSCHGEKGDGKGKLASQFNPPPRNFACAQTVSGIADGQLFWIIRNGSPGSGMPPARALGKFTDEDIWHLVAYIRQFAR